LTLQRGKLRNNGVRTVLAKRDRDRGRDDWAVRYGSEFDLQEEGGRAVRRLIIVVVLAATGVGLSPTAVSAKTSAAVSAGDTTVLKAGLLKIGDLPPGWRESPSSSSTLNLSKGGKGCARLQAAVDRSEKLKSAHGKSSDFKQGDIDSISNSATVYTTVAATTASLAVVERPEVGPCLQTVLTAQVRKSAPAGVTVSATVGKLSVAPAGDASVYEVVITARKQAVTLTVYADYQLVQVGRLGMTFQFEAQDSSALASQQPLVQTVVNRVRAAEAGAS
jgi:hypothetical protein